MSTSALWAWHADKSKVSKPVQCSRSLSSTCENREVGWLLFDWQVMQYFHSCIMQYFHSCISFFDHLIKYWLLFPCRLIRLVLTLPVSTATTERAFSAMKLVKTRLRNKMEDGFLRDCLLIYIEKELAVGFSTDDIIDEFNTESRRVPFDWKLLVHHHPVVYFAYLSPLL